MKNRLWALTIGLLCCAYGQLPANATDKDHAQKATQEHKESVEEQTSTAQEGKADKKGNFTLLSSMLYSGVLGLGFSFFLILAKDIDKQLLLKFLLIRHILLISLGALSGALTKLSLFDKCWIRNAFSLTFHIVFILWIVRSFSKFIICFQVDKNCCESKKLNDFFKNFLPKYKDPISELISSSIKFEVVILLVTFLLLEVGRMLILHKKEEPLNKKKKKEEALTKSHVHVEKMKAEEKVKS